MPRRDHRSKITKQKSISDGTRVTSQRQRNVNAEHDDAMLVEELRSVGLCIVPCIGDGNCLFRAISHQLCGDTDRHFELRLCCVHELRSNARAYEPFLLEEDGFGDMTTYISAMSNDGEWGGNVELIALARAFLVDICVHQARSPPWLVVGRASGQPTAFQVSDEDAAAAATLHVSYQNGNHYASIVTMNGSAVVRPDNNGKYFAASARANIWRTDLFETGLARSRSLAASTAIVNQTCGVHDKIVAVGPNDSEFDDATEDAIDTDEHGVASTAGVKTECPPDVTVAVPRRNGACICGSKLAYRRCCGHVARTRRRLTGDAVVDRTADMLGTLRI